MRRATTGLMLAACSAGVEGPSDESATTDVPSATDGAGDAVSLVDPTAWAPVEAADDPFADHRPDDARCPLGSWYGEDGGIEVATGDCTWGALGQPLQVDLARGDRVSLFLYHTELTSKDPDATGHVAVQVGDWLLWEVTVPIPADATPYSAEVRVPRDLRAGTPVFLHVHNHGYNTWKLLELERD